MKNIDEAKKGLWANIHAKRKRGERPARPGEKGYPKTLDIEEAKKDTDMYTYKDESKGQVIKGKSGTFVGYTHSTTKGKGANILKHNQTKKYYAAGGSSTAFTKKTTLHDTPEDAARAYHKGNLAEEEFNNEAYMGNVKPKKSAHQKFKDSMKRAGYDMDAGAKRLQDLLDRQKKEREDREMNSTKSEEASPMIKPPKNEFGKKEDAFAHAKKHGGKVMKKTFTHPTSGMQTVSYVVKEETELDEAIKLNSKVKIHAPGKDYHGKVGRVGEIRKGLHDKAPKTYTVDYDYDTKTGNKKSIQLDKSRLKMHNEEAEIDEAIKKPNATTRHLRDYPVSDKDVAKPVKQSEYQHHVVSKLDGNVLASYKSREAAHRNAYGNSVVSGSLETIGDRKYVREQGGAEGSDKLQGTPVVSLKDLGDKDNNKNKYGQTVPKKLKKNDPRVKFHKYEKQGVAEETKKMKGKDPCWTGYKMIGTKEKGGRQVPNCVPVKEGISFRVLREMTKCKPSKNS
jgi:hypothetical protein